MGLELLRRASQCITPLTVSLVLLIILLFNCHSLLFLLFTLFAIDEALAFAGLSFFFFTLILFAWIFFFFSLFSFLFILLWQLFYWLFFIRRLCLLFVVLLKRRDFFGSLTKEEYLRVLFFDNFSDNLISLYRLISRSFQILEAIAEFRVRFYIFFRGFGWLSLIGKENDCFCV